MSDEGEIEKIIKEVVGKNQNAVDDYKKGKENALQFLVGKVMAQSRGKANPELTQKILQDILTKII